jgi:hypothetical protein
LVHKFRGGIASISDALSFHALRRRAT